VVLALAAWLFGLAQRREAIGRDRGSVALGIAAAVSFAVALIMMSVGAFGPPQRGGGSVASAGALPSEPWSEERLSALRAAHTPVLVNFTAAWCVTCQVNERLAFSTGQVAKAFKQSGAVYLVADWTNRDGAIAEALGRQGRIGVPLYLVYGADGGEPKVLPQLLTPGVVAQALERAARSAS
jgi:thiol:disulfide interchange protein DsbD